MVTACTVLAIFYLLVGCREKTIKSYSYNTLMIEVLQDNDGHILLQATNKKNKELIKTNASIYSKYSIQIFSEKSFILFSSDIGDTFFVYENEWESCPVYVYPSPSSKYIAYVFYSPNRISNLASWSNPCLLLVCDSKNNVVLCREILLRDIIKSITWLNDTSFQIATKDKQYIHVSNNNVLKAEEINKHILNKCKSL